MSKFLEVLCFDKTINRDFHRKIIRDLQRIAADVFHDDIVNSYYDEYSDHTGDYDPNWGDQD